MYCYDRYKPLTETWRVVPYHSYVVELSSVPRVFYITICLFFSWTIHNLLYTALQSLQHNTLSIVSSLKFFALLVKLRKQLVFRSELFAELLSYVRIPLIHPSYFVNTIECDEQVITNPACQAILQETRKYHILGTN